jgi:hypothetical protein
MPGTTMFEKCAQAMVDGDGYYTVMDHHRERVRSVIDAMRELTPEMEAAGAADFPLIPPDVMRSFWLAMIDAALKGSDKWRA